MTSRPRLASRRTRSYGGAPIIIRIGSRHAQRRFIEVLVTGPRDSQQLARAVEEQVRSFPGEPLLMVFNGHQPWLGDVLSTCFEDYWDQISGVSRELQFSSTAQFPEKASRRTRYAPWTFIIDHINVPEVFYWSVDHAAPEPDSSGLINLDRAKMRVGVWFCAQDVCRFDRKISTTLIFTRPDEVSELVVRELLFDFLHKDEDFDQPREDEEGICWTFSRLYWLLTDWQNIIREVNARLEEAELNAHHRQFPVKYRTRTMHQEIARIYELKEYLRFHTRSFKKLQKLKANVPKNEQNDSLWDDMDDAVEDLDQFGETLGTLRERFDNLLSLEFNIQSADQSDNSSFLSVIATLFLPISYLAGLWGITTTTWDVLWYVYTAVPVFVVSIAFLLLWPWCLRRWQSAHYHLDQHRIVLKPRDFTMLGDELPDNVDTPGARRQAHGRHKSQMIGDAGLPATKSDRSRSRARPQGVWRQEKG